MNLSKNKKAIFSYSNFNMIKLSRKFGWKLFDKNYHTKTTPKMSTNKKIIYYQSKSIGKKLKEMKKQS